MSDAILGRTPPVTEHRETCAIIFCSWLESLTCILLHIANAYWWLHLYVACTGCLYDIGVVGIP